MSDYKRSSLYISPKERRRQARKAMEDYSRPEHLAADGVPVVEVEPWHGGWKVRQCPYCGRPHEHGGALGLVEHRHPDCTRDVEHRGYYVVKTLDWTRDNPMQAIERINRRLRSKGGTR